MVSGSAWSSVTWTGDRIAEISDPPSLIKTSFHKRKKSRLIDQVYRRSRVKVPTAKRKRQLVNLTLFNHFVHIKSGQNQIHKHFNTFASDFPELAKTLQKCNQNDTISPAFIKHRKWLFVWLTLPFSH